MHENSWIPDGGVIHYIYIHEGLLYFKGVLKIAESGNSKTVNYIVIGRFLTVLRRFLQKKFLNLDIPPPVKPYIGRTNKKQPLFSVLSRFEKQPNYFETTLIIIIRTKASLRRDLMKSDSPENLKGL